MKRALLRALALLLALAAMFLGGSVRAMSAMPAEGDAPSAEGGVLPGAEAPAEG